jgi:hypothetical protein
MCGIEQHAIVCHHGSNMRDAPNAEMLQAMKESLRSLENAKLINPEDIELLTLKRALQAKIEELESRQHPDVTKPDAQKRP